LAKKIALMGQSADVYFPYTVRETVEMGRYAWQSGFASGLSLHDRVVVDRALDRLGLTEISHSMIDQLSGGQLQRVFLARTFAQESGVILLDEPTNNLDLRYQLELLEYLKEWTRERERGAFSPHTVVAVLHDINLARKYADQIVLLKQGSVAASGVPGDILTGDSLRAVFGIDVVGFMRESLSRWDGGRCSSNGCSSAI
jgi:iron complex transport system ATP-binding protein